MRATVLYDEGLAPVLQQQERSPLHIEGGTVTVVKIHQIRQRIKSHNRPDRVPLCLHSRCVEKSTRTVYAWIKDSSSSTIPASNEADASELELQQPTL